MSWIRRHLVSLILYGIALIGAGLIAYPTFSDWWNGFHQSRAVASYASAVSDMNTETYDELFAQAEDYNKKLSETGTVWIMDDEQLEEYNSLLRVDDSGVMGYINIPKINIMLPVYHGIDEAVLQVAIGHLEGTSLPTGGGSTHCVVSGHRGLPSARLFTDLDKLVVGDTWTVNVLNRTLTYEVDAIHIVEPTDLSLLAIEEGKDLFTLVTCTPYGINTHRLLVRGHRVENAQGDAEVVADALQIDTGYTAIFMGVPVLLVLFLWAMTSTGRRRRRARRTRRTVRQR